MYFSSFIPRDFEGDIEDAEMERDRRGSLSSVASTATTGTSDSSSSGGGVANKVGIVYSSGKHVHEKYTLVNPSFI